MLSGNELSRDALHLECGLSLEVHAPRGELLRSDALFE